MALRDAFNQFAPASKAALVKWSRALDTDDGQLAAKREELSRATAALGEAVAADPVDTDLTAVLRQKRKQLAEDIAELGETRAYHLARHDDAREAEDARLYAKEREAARKIAETKNRSFVQGVGDMARAADKLAALLPQLHEGREQFREAADRVKTLAGVTDGDAGPIADLFEIDEMILRSGPAYGLADIISPFAYDPLAEFPRLDVAFAERAAAAKASYEIDIGLRQPEPEPAPDPAIAEEEARRVAAAEAHQRHVQSPEYDREQRARAGSAPRIPGVTPTPHLTAQGGFTPEFLEQQARAHRRQGRGASINPHTGRTG